MMEEEMKIRRCLFCKKKLLDEKVPICLRCKLSGRNKVGKGGAILTTTALTYFQIRNAVDSNSKPTDVV